MGIRERLTQFFRSPSSREQDRRMTTQAAGRATSEEDEISQREVRRLARMSEADQAWEQDALRRSRTNQDGVMPEDPRRQPS